MVSLRFLVPSQVLEALAPYAIGRLSDQSMEELRDVRNPSLGGNPGTSRNLASYKYIYIYICIYINIYVVSPSLYMKPS